MPQLMVSSYLANLTRISLPLLFEGKVKNSWEIEDLGAYKAKIKTKRAEDMKTANSNGNGDEIFGKNEKKEKRTRAQ